MTAYLAMPGIFISSFLSIRNLWTGGFHFPEIIPNTTMIGINKWKPRWFRGKIPALGLRGRRFDPRRVYFLTFIFLFSLSFLPVGPEWLFCNSNSWSGFEAENGINPRGG